MLTFLRILGLGKVVLEERVTNALVLDVQTTVLYFFSLGGGVGGALGTLGGPGTLYSRRSRNGSLLGGLGGLLGWCLSPIFYYFTLLHT